MKTAELKMELFILLVAVLPLATLVLHYVYKRNPDRVRIVETATTGPIYVDALLENEGGQGLVSVWLEQGGLTLCRTVTYLDRRESRRVTIACPGLTQDPFKVHAQAQ
ncbi:hypothetical protein Q9316_15195 [Shinella zoogloeoides]|jgi:hypothetical protein|nr:hypothetical protein Q9316_15195 [Shinella zoogloeoides]